MGDFYKKISHIGALNGIFIWKLVQNITKVAKIHKVQKYRVPKWVPILGPRSILETFWRSWVSKRSLFYGKGTYNFKNSSYSNKCPEIDNCASTSTPPSPWPPPQLSPPSLPSLALADSRFTKRYLFRYLVSNRYFFSEFGIYFVSIFPNSVYFDEVSER